MRYIDMTNWPRKTQFDFFRQMHYPHFNLTANLDITTLCHYAKERDLSIFKCILFLTMKTANDTLEFRLRIRGEQVVEHELIHPSFTVLREDETFAFCPAEYSPVFSDFCAEVAKRMDEIKQCSTLGEEADNDAQIYVTSIPWVSFTSLVHPIHLDPTDSVPRIAWGKYFEENGKVKLPFSVQAHHALADGLHVGKYFGTLQRYFDEPQLHL